MYENRPDRAVGNKGDHSLIHSEPGGANRFQPGKHICACGLEFSGLGKWEKHRAEERRKAKYNARG